MADENNITTLAKRLRPFMKLAAQEMVPVTAYDHGALSGLSDDDHTQYVLETTSITAGAGLTGGGQLSADRTLTVGAGLGITVNADDVALTTPGTLTVSSTNSASGSHTHAVTSSSNPGAAASLLASDVNGYLTLTQLKTDLLGDRSGGNLTVMPTGDLVLNPQGDDVYPLYNYDLNLGLITNKFLTLHAAELWVETLVAQETMATIGGRILVGPTTTLVIDLGSAGTYMIVKHNQMALDDIGYLESDGKVEFIQIDGYPLTVADATNDHFTIAGDHTTEFQEFVTFRVEGTGTANDDTWTVDHSTLNGADTEIYVAEDITSTTVTGGHITWQSGAPEQYRYCVITRDKDGSGANDWYAGDAVFNTGGTGDGFMDLYSLRGVKASTEYGPTIVGNVRASATYNDWGPRWAIGNLNGLYGYSSDLYGVGMGQYASAKANVTIDETNGFRLRSYTTTILQIKNTDGMGYIVGPLYLDTAGGIYQGTGTFASPTTGLKMWNDSGYGRIGGYNSSALQWFVDTDGKLYAGGSGKGVALSAAGLRLNVTSEVPPATDIQWLESATTRLQLGVDLAFDDAYLVTTENFRITASAGTITLDAAAYIATGAADDLRVGGGLYVGDVGTDPVAGRVYTGYTQTLTVDVAEGYCAAYMAYPTYSGGYTVTRHSYIYLNQPTLASGAAVTDACVFRFSSAAGTHKAVDSGSTKSSPGTVSAWVKVDVAGTIYYIPAYTSKTS